MLKFDAHQVGPTPKDAAGLIIVTNTRPQKVVMIQRAQQSPFLGGAWAFPGGKVSATDRTWQDVRGVATAADGYGPEHLAAALRESKEEIGFALPSAASCSAFARWITPTAEPRRFDARFFLVICDPEALLDLKPDGFEAIALRIDTPSAFVSEYHHRRLWLAPPTLHTLMTLEAMPDTAVKAHGTPVFDPIFVVGPPAQLLLPGHPDHPRKVTGPSLVIRFTETDGFWEPAKT